ncbi:MAG: hypothetical protein PHR13_12140 [Dysgonamonadaceae bacterium]|nr:hypothetical protein [Dysgonamonadaceae bacterium]MDD3901913.1 hypothetical protein [Dysgonamonadaceae bacterium]MDD4400249.1 hypothetical protein [Dysgonamonadaceae bacterium]
MLKELSKETHVFLKTEDSFTSISKRPRNNKYQVFTTKKITSQMGDDINNLYGANLEVTRINFDQGFIIIRLKNKSTYRHIVKAIKSVLYGKS